MLCEKILGNLNATSYEGRQIEYVEIDWHDAFHKIHKKITNEGTEVGIRLDNDVLIHGLKEGDVLYDDGTKLIAVHILPCESILITIQPHHAKMVAKVCYEIGNRHATLFWGDTPYSFITPYNEPTLVMLNKLHGVKTEVASVALDFTKAISSSINAHTH